MARYKGDKRRKPESLRDQILARPSDEYNRQREQDLISKARKKHLQGMVDREFGVEESNQKSRELKSKYKELQNENRLAEQEKIKEKRAADELREAELEAIERPFEDAMIRAEQNEKLLEKLSKQFENFKKTQDAMDKLNIDPEYTLSPNFILAQIPDEFKAGYKPPEDESK